MKRFTQPALLTLGFALIAVMLLFVPSHNVTAAVSSPSPAPSASDVDDPAVQPFETNLCLDNASGVSCSQEATKIGQPYPSSFIVPTTTASNHPVRRLVVDYVSGVCFDAFFAVALVTPLSANQVNGVTAAHNFFTGTVEGSQFVFSQTTAIYVDPGAAVNLFVNQWVASDGVCIMSVNGHLVTN